VSTDNHEKKRQVGLQIGILYGKERKISIENSFFGDDKNIKINHKARNTST
jgi:hypothetical protein